MGNKIASRNEKNVSSKSEEEEVAELQRRVNLVIMYLDEHENAVDNISHSVQTQMALVLMLSHKISNIVSLKEIDGQVKKNDCPVAAVTCLHCTSEWQDYTDRLLRSVQSSLHCESKSLKTSFERLKLYVQHTIKDYYKIEAVTSFGKENLCDGYKGSPTTDTQAANMNSRSDVKTSENTKYANQLQEVTKNHEQYKMKAEEKLQILQEKKESLEITIKEIQKNNEGLEHQIQVLQSNIKELQTKTIALEEDMNRSKQTITVQLFHNLKGGMIATLLYELKSMLATQLNIKRHEVQFVLCQTETDVNPQIPVFVFCINSSRLGTDAGLAIQNLKVSSKMSILIFHHKDVHALPNQASERVLTEPEFKSLGGIFDIGFLSGKGIYACDMNRAASAGIGSFLRAAQS